MTGLKMSSENICELSSTQEAAVQTLQPHSSPNEITGDQSSSVMVQFEWVL